MKKKLISAQFSKIMRTWLTKPQLNEVNAKNATYEYINGNMCATHEYYDSNMAMLEAFEKVMKIEFSLQNKAHCKLFNKAWEISKINKFKN